MRVSTRIDPAADHAVKLSSALLYLSANDADAATNELRTHLVITADAESGMGMFSLSDPLGLRMASSGASDSATKRS